MSNHEWTIKGHMEYRAYETEWNQSKQKTQHSKPKEWTAGTSNG